MDTQRERTVRVVSLVLTLIAVSAYLAISDGTVAMSVRGLLGVDGRERPVVEADGTGEFAFLQTQRGGGEPVGFSPCRNIEYVVNPADGPADWEQQVTSAVGELSDRTGLEFTFEGATDERDFGRRESGDPVLIGWADEEEVDGLADDVIGLGGPTIATLGNRSFFVSGSVVIDTSFTDQVDDALFGEELERALLLHELGHLAGLDHVDDPGELMYPDGPSRSDYGPGDLEGLARLGAIACR